MTTSQILVHDEVSACVALDEPAPSQIEHWAHTWAEYFRRDAEDVEKRAAQVRSQLQHAMTVLEG